MFIEDIVQKVVLSTITLNSFDSKIISSLYYQLVSGNNFTEKQATLVVNILKKYKAKLSLAFNINISNLLDKPQFKHKFRNINMNKTINIIDNKEFSKVIKVSFPYNEILISKFKEEKTNFHCASWDNVNKSWIFSLHEKNILFLMKLIDEFDFQADHEFMNYVEQIKNIKQNIENYIPMVVKEKDNYVLTNVYKSCPTFLGQDLISSLFEARKKGIYVWDNVIENDLKNNIENTVVKDFLKYNNEDKFIFDLEHNPLCLLSTIVKNLFPCLVIIPGGNELALLKKNYEFFNTMNINNNNISVMFRLSNETDNEFNNFVKQHNLNNPITKNTQIVFISNNIPKPVLDSSINFDLILNYNFFSPHYKLRDYIDNHHNVINVVEKYTEREIKFWPHAR